MPARSLSVGRSPPEQGELPSASPGARLSVWVTSLLSLGGQGAKAKPDLSCQRLPWLCASNRAFPAALKFGTCVFKLLYTAGRFELILSKLVIVQPHSSGVLPDQRKCSNYSLLRFYFYSRTIPKQLNLIFDK